MIYCALILGAAFLTNPSYSHKSLAVPSSLIQLSNESGTNLDPILQRIKDQVAGFQKKMSEEVTKDKEEMRHLRDEQRRMERDEKAFKSHIFASDHSSGSSSFAQIHFGDPYIDEAMRTIGNDIESQKRELERLVDRSSLVETHSKRPDLGVIGAALRARLNMVNNALVNHIQKSTFDFDKRIQDTKNSEEASIENIELQERNVDRELDSIRQKFHLRPVSSFLQKQNDDAKLIRDSELAREQAEEDMINVEEQIANIPKQLFPLRTR